jgi:hypothetical protein
LDASVRDDEEDSVLGDFIEDEDTKTPTESASEQLLKEQVKQILGTLTEREQKILKLRFGLEDGKSHTLEEVGQEFSVTRERIRQIEAKALAKLRKHKDTRKLHEYDTDYTSLAGYKKDFSIPKKIPKGYADSRHMRTVDKYAKPTAQLRALMYQLAKTVIFHSEIYLV